MPKKKVSKKADGGIQYQQGNGELQIIKLLVLICNKLDVIKNHTTNMVEQNEDLIKEIRDNVG